MSTIIKEVAGMAVKLPPIHPGEILLEEFLKPLGISQTRLALDLRVPAQRVNDLVRGRRSVSVDTAMRLAAYFGTTPEVWLNLQTRFDLEKAEDENLAERIKEEVRPRAVNG
ncbi:MAG: HigA family addiction module antitoxin [Desulfovibrionaceae bacterium]|uniref:HigA family addiction module antitoxin n=2 Tax=Desulfovibrio aminophilus TaxID=81425 RepID=UPI002A3B7021|nr:HigA family addiction module antitoxin [Desulfovibrionaceae bacterium]